MLKAEEQMELAVLEEARCEHPGSVVTSHRTISQHGSGGIRAVAMRWPSVSLRRNGPRSSIPFKASTSSVA